jgi:hypothetical protein
MSHSMHWNDLPEAVKTQAAARWPSGSRAAGPGDGYLYEYAYPAPPDGHQYGLFPITSAYRLAPEPPRLLGRRRAPPEPIIIRTFSRIDFSH